MEPLPVDIYTLWWMGSIVSGLLRRHDLDMCAVHTPEYKRLLTEFLVEPARFDHFVTWSVWPLDVAAIFK